MKKRGATINRDSAIRALVDANTFGDAKAAQLHDVHDRTIKRWRALFGKSPEFAEKLHQIAKADEVSWHYARTAALHAILMRSIEVAKSETDLSKLSQAAERIGNIDIAATALLRPSEMQTASAPAPAPGGSEPSSCPEGDDSDQGVANAPQAAARAPFGQDRMAGARTVKWAGMVWQ